MRATGPPRRSSGGATEEERRCTRPHFGKGNRTFERPAGNSNPLQRWFVSGLMGRLSILLSLMEEAVTFSII